MRTRVIAAFAATLSAATLASCSVESGGTDGQTLTVGIVNSYTGPLANFGPAWEAGYRAGLKSLTNGSYVVDGVKIEIEVRDDKADPATGLNAAKELLGSGTRLIVGTASSAVNVPLAQAVVDNDAMYIAGSTVTADINGMGKGVFRSGMTNAQYNRAVVKAALAANAKTITYVGQDYAYGQDALQSLKEIGEAEGLTVNAALLPPSTQDFTAGVALALANRPDFLYSGWVGQGQPQLFNALSDQGAFTPDSKTKIISVAPMPQGYDAFAAAVGPDSLANVLLLSNYGEGIAGTAAEEDMLEQLKDDETPIDTQQQQGYLAAQMTVRAVEAGGAQLDIDKVDEALSGTSFDSVVGTVTIRGVDHQILAPAFDCRLVKDGSSYRLELIGTFSAESIEPPIGKTIR